MRKIDIIIEAVFDRRPGSELRLGPDFQDGGGKDVRGRVTETLDVGHLCALLQSFAFVLHERQELTTKVTKDTKKFMISLCMRAFAAAAVLLLISCNRSHTQNVDPAAARQNMIKEQLSARGIHDERVLAAMGKVPREEFVPGDERDLAYTDQALPIGHGQTISQPFVVALMTEQLRAKPTDRVLEIGTGSGYQAAILAQLVADVYSIEIIEPLAKTAETTLQRLGCKNVHIKTADGYKGWPEAAPFDGIIVTCAPDHVPDPLREQLKEGGRMVIPVGGPFEQELYVLEKSNGELRQQAVEPVRFVPMTGEAERKK